MKIKYIVFNALILSMVLALQSSAKIPIMAEKDTTAKQTVVFISDTQVPMWFEKLFVKTHRNEEAGRILLNAIQSDSTVKKVFFLGDVVSMGSINKNWRRIDTFLTDLKAKNVTAYVTAGNHDYLLSSEDGESNLKKRFPEFNRTGYTIRDGRLAVVLLNSNFSELSHSELVQQQDWYAGELQSLEKDTSVNLVIVCCHHSPFSNSSIVGSSKKVRERFLPPFRSSSKCRVFISGHAHTFQHFVDSLKHFLVIGGGGGLLHKLKERKSNEPQDMVKWDTKYRMFHFVSGGYTRNGFLLKVMMLTEDLQGPRPVYEIFIPLKE